MKTTDEMQVIPAALGYFVLDYCEDDESDELILIKTAVIAWRIDRSDLEYVTPIPVMLDPLTNEKAVLRPDGAVEDGESEYPSVAAWLVDRKAMIARWKASKAAQLAKNERLTTGGAR